jgi:nucleoporin POM34
MPSSRLAVAARNNSTPVKQTPAPIVQESPGNWKHPRLAEITRRQNKTVFSEKNIKQIIYNVVALVSAEMLRSVLVPYFPSQL